MFRTCEKFKRLTLCVHYVVSCIEWNGKYCFNSKDMGILLYNDCIICTTHSQLCTRVIFFFEDIYPREIYSFLEIRNSQLIDTIKTLPVVIQLENKYCLIARIWVIT